MTGGDTSSACPSCGGTARSFGTRDIRVVAVEDGLPGRRTVQVRRYRCECGAVFREGPPALAGDAREAVALMAVREGIRAASRRAGMHDRTVRALLAQEVGRRKAGLDFPELDAVGFERVPGRGGGIIVAYDPDGHAVLDVVDSVEGVGDWLGTHAPGLRLAVVGVDPALADAVRAACPGAVVAVAPTSAMEAVKASGRKAVAAIARKRTGNFREDVRHVDVPDAALDDDAADAMRCWSPAARAVRRAVLSVLEALSGTGDGIAAVADFLDGVAPGSGLAALLRKWGEAFASGARERWVDPSARRCAELATRISALRPLAVADMVRVIFLDAAASALPSPSIALAIPATSGAAGLDDAMAAVEATWGGG